VLARDRECLVVALADLLGGDSLFEPVVSRHEQIVDLLPGFIGIDVRIMPEG
jgi:hypothetical protein